MATAAQTNQDPFVVTTEPDSVILDYGILTPRPNKFNPADEAKHTARVLVKKGSPTALAFAKAEEAAKQERWGSRPPVGFRSALVDGDAVDGAGQRMHPDYYAGCIAVTAKANISRPPTCWVGKERRKAEAADFYSGMTGVVVARAFAYDNASRGVSFGLNLCWKTGPGNRIAGGVDAESAAVDLMAAKVTWSDDANVEGFNDPLA